MNSKTITLIFTAQEAQESQDLQDWWGSQVPKEPEVKQDCGEKWDSWDRQVGQGSQV
jgi:isochorismate hydrolase